MPDLYRCCSWILTLRVPEKFGGKDADMLLKAFSALTRSNSKQGRSDDKQATTKPNIPGESLNHVNV
jgi:hypothetical protein